MSAAAATRTPGYFKQGYDSRDEYRRDRLYNSGSSQRRRFHDRDVDYGANLRTVKNQRSMLDITAGFYEPVAASPKFKIGFKLEGVLDGQQVSGEITNAVTLPFGETMYTFIFNGQERRNIRESRLDDLIAHLQTAVAAPPTVAVVGTVDAAVSGAIVVAQTMAIVPFGFWK